MFSKYDEENIFMNILFIVDLKYISKYISMKIKTKLKIGPIIFLQLN